MSKVIEVVNLGFKDVLKGVNFKIERGSVLGLFGPNGSGKTTLLRLLSGVLTPSEGFIRYSSENPSESLSWSFEPPILPVHTSISEYRRYLTSIKGVTEDIDKLIEGFNLGAYRYMDMHRLSSGNMKKASLAFTLSRDVACYLLDEPGINLDDQSKSFLLNILMDKVSQGRSIVISTHEFELFEGIVTDILILDRGRQLFYGGVNEVAGSIGVAYTHEEIVLDGVVTKKIGDKYLYIGDREVLEGRGLDPNPPRLRDIYEYIFGVGS